MKIKFRAYIESQDVVAPVERIYFDKNIIEVYMPDGRVKGYVLDRVELM